MILKGLSWSRKVKLPHLSQLSTPQFASDSRAELQERMIHDQEELIHYYRTALARSKQREKRLLTILIAYAAREKRLINQEDALRRENCAQRKELSL